MFYFLIYFLLFYVLFFVNQGVVLLNEEFLIFLSLVLLFTVLFNSLSKILKFFMFSNVEKIYFTFLYVILVNITINEKSKNFFNYLFLDFYYFIRYEFLFLFFYSFSSLSSLYNNTNLFFFKKLNNFIFKNLSSFSFSFSKFNFLSVNLKNYFLSVNLFELSLTKFISFLLFSNISLGLFFKNLNNKKLNKQELIKLNKI
jgi:hypothetical protein